MPDSLSFEDLTRLTDRETQVLLREVDQKDLVTALIGANKKITAKFLSNMSERVRTFIEEEIAASSPLSKDKIEEPRQRMLQQVAQLVEQGQITLPSAKKKAPKRKPKLSKRHLDMKRNLKKTTQSPLLQLSYQEIDQAFVGLAEIGKKEGILALGQVIEGTDEDFLNYGVRLAVDGTEPDLIMDILETWMGSLLHEHKRKYQKVIEGIMAIQSGDHPRIVESKLKCLY